jgi:vitamin B12 transporter
VQHHAFARPCSAFFLTFTISIPLVATSAPPVHRGVVVDQTGRPVPRAVVTVDVPGDRDPVEGFTDAAGRFEIHADAPPGCRVSVALAGFAAAEAACDIDRPLRLVLALAPVSEAVVVTATRGEAPASQLAAGVSVFESADLERRQRPLVADVLRAAPGVAVVRVGGFGNVTSLFVRGGESNYTKVLLDGVPLNEPGGAFNFGNVTSEHLERIELVRGAQSALFGSDAMSGVVQMFTARAADDRVRYSATLEGGSFSTGRGSIGVADRQGAVDYAVHAAYSTTDNQVPNNAFRNSTVSGSAGIRMAGGASLRLIARGEFGRTGVPGATAFGRADEDAFFESRSGVGGATFLQQVSPDFHHRGTYALAASDQRSANLLLDDPYVPTFGGRSAPFLFFDFAYDSRTTLLRHYASYQGDWRVADGSAAGTHLSTFAFEWDGERARMRDALAATSSRHGRDNFGWTFQHQALWPRAFVTAGVRIEKNDSFGTAAVPRASVAYVLRRSSGRLGETKLEAAAGQGIKEPTMLQSFSASPSFLGNPDLSPERSRTVEAGIEQRLAGDRAKVEVTWFDGEFRNIISTRTLTFNPLTSQYFNIGRTRARGVELAGDIAPLSALRLRGGYTFLDSRILESTAPLNPVFREGQWVFRRPRHSGYLDMSWSQGRFGIDVLGVFTGRRTDSDFSALEPPLVFNDAYARWDLRARYRLSAAVTARLAIDNLADADYMEPLGYPVPGRAVRTGLQVSF